jgi:hypothetical protein
MIRLRFCCCCSAVSSTEVENQLREAIQRVTSAGGKPAADPADSLPQALQVQPGSMLGHKSGGLHTWGCTTPQRWCLTHAACPQSRLSCLQEANTALTHRILSALAAKQQGASGAAASDFPLGFNTGGDT